MLFPEDPFLSHHHASFFVRDGTLFVRDEGGLSGTFVRIHGPEALAHGSQFAVGDHLVRFVRPIVPPPTNGPIAYGAPPPSGTLYVLEELYEGARPGRACMRPGPVLTVGRGGGDLSFPADMTVQPRHCEVAVDSVSATLRDLGGPGGTFIRLPVGGERSLVAGDEIRFGLVMVRVEAA